MPVIPFVALPDHARLWVFGAAQPILGDDAERLMRHVDDFVDGWHAHGQPVVGAFDWRYEHFLFVAADEEATGVSGCSIDSLFRSLRGLEDEIGATLLDSSLVWYRGEGGHVRSAARPEFRQMVRDGDVDEETIVFDNTVTTIGAVRAGEWERPFRESWHARAFAAAR